MKTKEKEGNVSRKKRRCSKKFKRCKTEKEIWGQSCNRCVWEVNGNMLKIEELLVAVTVVVVGHCSGKIPSFFKSPYTNTKAQHQETSVDT